MDLASTVRNDHTSNVHSKQKHPIQVLVFQRYESITLLQLICPSLSMRESAVSGMTDTFELEHFKSAEPLDPTAAPGSELFLETQPTLI